MSKHRPYKYRPGGSKNRTRKTRLVTPVLQIQPAPSTPGVTAQMVRQHARRLFRDKWLQKRLSPREWLLAEKDLVHVLEAGMFE